VVLWRRLFASRAFCRRWSVCPRDRLLGVADHEEDDYRDDDHEDGKRHFAVAVVVVAGSSHHSSGAGCAHKSLRSTTDCRAAVVTENQGESPALQRGEDVKRLPSGSRAPQQHWVMPNCFTSVGLCACMDDIDPDTAMIAAGVVISLIAALEFYPAWRDSRRN
jgi:hypothetical protein